MAELLFSEIYNIWAMFVLETLTLIFWLVGFTLLAAIAANVNWCLNRDENKRLTACPGVNGFEEAATYWNDMSLGRKGQACLAAGAGVGAICL
jgi:hypothetical protein